MRDAERAVRELSPPDVRVGVDIVDIPRFARVLDRRPAIAERLFTADERARCQRAKNPVPHYAARFAAKEAARKALGRAVAWTDVEIRSGETGAPTLALADGLNTADGRRVMGGSVSLSHDGDAAIAIVLLSTS